MSFKPIGAVKKTSEKLATMTNRHIASTTADTKHRNTANAQNPLAMRSGRRAAYASSGVITLRSLTGGINDTVLALEPSVTEDSCDRLTGMTKLALFDVFIERSWAEKMGFAKFIEGLPASPLADSTDVLVVPTHKINHEDYTFLQVTVRYSNASETVWHIPKSQVVGIVAFESKADRLGFIKRKGK
jgi:hypothetical protein